MCKKTDLKSQKINFIGQFFYEKIQKNHLLSYFKNLLEKYKNIIISPIAKNPNKARSCGLINLKLFDSIAKKLSPIIFKDLQAVAKPNIVKIIDRRTIIPKDFIFIDKAPKIPIRGRDKNMLRIVQ